MFNVENHISNCLKMLVSQTNQDFELILVNDGSTDNTQNIASSFSRYFKDFKIMSQQNCGSFAARLNGVSASSNQYVAFIDADDTVKNTFVEIITEHLNKSRLDILMFNSITVTKGRTFYSKKYDREHMDSKQYFTSLFKLDVSPVLWNKIIRRDLFTNVNKCKHKLSMGEDLLTTSSIINNADNIVLINDYLYTYSFYENSTSRGEFNESKLNQLETALNLHEQVLLGSLPKEQLRSYSLLHLAQSFFFVYWNIPNVIIEKRFLDSFKLNHEFSILPKKYKLLFYAVKHVRSPIFVRFIALSLSVIRKLRY